MDIVKSTQPLMGTGQTNFKVRPNEQYLFDVNLNSCDDVLNQNVNMIEPEVLTELKNPISCKNDVLIDPRNKRIVNKILHDYTLETSASTSLFEGICSTLKKTEQFACWKVLKAYQNFEKPEQTDLIVWENTAEKRLAEKSAIEKFILNMEISFWIYIKRHCIDLDNLYIEWFKLQANLSLQKSWINTYYLIHSLPALQWNIPMPQQMLTTNVNMNNFNVIKNYGFVPILSNKHNDCCKQILNRVSRFNDYFNDSLPARESYLQNEIHNIIENASNQCNVFIPIETLLYLFTLGDYADLPTLCHVEVRATDDGNMLVFDKPLPSKKCGVHTQTQMVEQALSAYFTFNEDLMWLDVNSNTKQSFKQSENEIEASSCKIDYKVLEQNDFMSKKSVQAQRPIIKYSTVVLNWKLEEISSKKTINIITSTSLPPAYCEDYSDKDFDFSFYSSYFVKLEKKAVFGCEEMTKYELIKAWLQMKFTSSIVSTKYAKCLRISIKTFETQLLENLSMESVEQQLIKKFNINISTLLTNLFTFFESMRNLPCTQYILNYNQLIKEQIMVLSLNSIQSKSFCVKQYLDGTPNVTSLINPDILKINPMLCNKSMDRDQSIPLVFSATSENNAKCLFSELKMNVDNTSDDSIPVKNSKNFKKKKPKTKIQKKSNVRRALNRKKKQIMALKKKKLDKEKEKLILLL